MSLYKEPKKALVSVGRMYADNVYELFLDSLAEMLLYTQAEMCGPDEYVHYQKAPCSWHALGRNTLVANMRGDWLLQLDTDHCFAPDLLKRMFTVIEHNPDIKVLSGIYQSKHPPHNPVLGLWVGDKAITPILDWDRSKETLQVGVVPGGCLLVHKDVFKKIAQAYGGAPFDIIEGLSEDYSFCWRCRELGIPIYVAPHIQCHHVIKTVLSVEDYVAPQGAKVQTATGDLTKG